MDFKNKEISADKLKNNIEQLEIGSYIVTCNITSPSGKTATAYKTVNITALATTQIDNNNKKQEAKSIYSEYDLAYFSDLVNKKGEVSINGKIENQIDLNKVCNQTEGNWNSIGTDSNKYQGIFEGNSISNIYINAVDENGKGLFGYIENASIKNITLENGNIVARI